MEWRQQELLAAWVGAESQEGIDVEAVALLVGGLHFLEVLGRPEIRCFRDVYIAPGGRLPLRIKQLSH